jgi:hypothetical protein
MNTQETPTLSREQLGILAEAFKAIANAAPEDKKAVGTTHTGMLLHGPGGLFSTFGLDRDVITAHIEPMGLISQLPTNPSIDTDPRYASITGVTDSTGAQPDNACEDAPTAYLKGCNLTARFGMIRFDTNDIEWDKVLTRYNRGDFMDLQLLGGMLGEEAMRGGIVPGQVTQDDIMNIVTLTEMMIVGVQTQRELIRQSWQGNVNLANEFPGLDSQITTGIMDADIQGKLCTALDSDVKNFGYDDVCGTGRDIAEYLSSMMWTLEYNARRMKLQPVKWAIVLNPNLWYELSACWPCLYLTNRCRTNAGTEVAVINDELNVGLRDKMRDSMVIPVNGVNYDVIVDDGVFEHNAVNNQNLNPGEFAGSIYAVPLTILGRVQSTYREHLDYRSSVANANVAPFNQYRRDFWTDGGSFSWAYDGILWCFKLALKTEQRVILRTPQLAGRIDYVKYSPTQHLRSPWPDSQYFHDGGVSFRPNQRTTYAAWSNAANHVVPD